MTGPSTRSKRTFPLFRIAGIRVDIDYTWFIIFVLVTWSLSSGYFPLRFPALDPKVRWTAAIATSVLFFLSIVFHEFFHSLVALRMGISIRSITLFMFGGASHLSRETKTPSTEFLIAAAGPLSSLALGLVLLAAGAHVSWVVHPVLHGLTSFLGWINISLGVFNLIPAFPLDGGRILRAAVWWKTGSPAYAIKLSTDMGKGFALAVAALGLVQVFTGKLFGGLWLVLIGLFLRRMAIDGMEGFVIRHSIGDIKVRSVMIDGLERVPPDIPVDRLITEYFLKTSRRVFPVFSDGVLVGTVSLESVLALSNEDRKRAAVRDIMIPVSEDCEISPDVNLADALDRMTARNITSLVVKENGALVGILNRDGVMRLMELRGSKDRSAGGL